MAISKMIFRSIAIIALFVTCIARGQETKNGLVWYTDINKAYEVSNQTHKPIFAFFTGSDWCVWCHRLEANVFDKNEFKAWAKNSVILLELDFPRNKKQPEQLMQQNAGLQQAFQVQGYPTCWIFNMTKDAASGKFGINAFGQLGYPQSQPGKEVDAFLENANKILSNKKS